MCGKCFCVLACVCNMFVGIFVSECLLLCVRVFVCVYLSVSFVCVCVGVFLYMCLCVCVSC